MSTLLHLVNTQTGASVWIGQRQGEDGWAIYSDNSRAVAGFLLENIGAPLRVMNDHEIEAAQLRGELPEPQPPMTATEVLARQRLPDASMTKPMEEGQRVEVQIWAEGDAWWPGTVTDRPRKMEVRLDDPLPSPALRFANEAQIMAWRVLA